MKQLFDDTFLSIAISEEHSLVKLNWKPSTDTMQDDEFKEMGIVLLDVIKEYLPRRNFSDTRNFLYSIAPNMQTWYSETVIEPSVNLCIKKLALLISQGFYSQLSIEQLINENPSLGFTTRYFEDENEAWDWVSQA